MLIRPKWILLQLTSILCFVTVFPMIFSAVPLAMIRFEAQRLTYYVMTISSLLLLSLYFGVMKAEATAFVIGYALIVFWGSLVAELLLKMYGITSSVRKNKKFWNVYLLSSLIPLVLIFLFLYMKLGTLSFEKIYPQVEEFALKTLKEPSSLEIIAELKKSSAPEANEALLLLENPQKFTSQILFMIPTYVLVGYFVIGFFTVFFIGRLQAFLGNTLDPNWAKEVILNFRNHDIFILGALIALAWNLFYTKLPISSFWIENGELIGSSLISIFGVFFFFQGLMCILHLFNLWGIKGFLGGIILFTVLFLALKSIAILGLIDMWLDFRTKNFYMKKDKI